MVHGQPRQPQQPTQDQPQDQPREDTQSPAADAPAPDGGVAAPPEAANADAAVEEPAPLAEPEHHGDKPMSAEDIVNDQPPVVSAPPPPPVKEEPAKQEKPSAHGKIKEEPAAAPSTLGPLVVWATADWASAFGPARCGPVGPSGDRGLQGADTAVRIGSALKQSVAFAGLGYATAGALGDHPLVAFAAHRYPDRLAEIIASAGYSALGVGLSDMSGTLMRYPRFVSALQERGVSVIASNLVCGRNEWCQSWHTAEDPLPIIERSGRRYALISVLPDDVLLRIDPAGGNSLELKPALDTIARRTEEARAAGADLIVASIDHGPDATASVNLANFVAQLPVEMRPDLLLSPSSGENLLFLRPLDVVPAIVGTRRDVLTGVRVTKLEGRDSDVFARSVRLPESTDGVLASQVQALGESFCRLAGEPLAGASFEVPLSNADFIELAGASAREMAEADLALVDPRAYDPSFAQPAGAHLQRAEAERAVLFDAQLVSASVPLDWLNNLNKMLDGLRPLTLIGVTQEKGDTLIAGRVAVTGASYRIVTTSVLARSGRLPAGANWSPVNERHATLRGALLDHLAHGDNDPRTRLRDPLLGTQWILRADGQVMANLTAVSRRDRYSEEPALQVDASRQLGGRLLINLDADAPKFLFENVGSVSFDRNFATNTTAQDLTFLQNTYTYRGLWPEPLLYPHPFAENYLETAFLRGTADYRHLLLRPKVGVRSIFSRVFSLKVAAGLQWEVYDEGRPIYPGLSVELLLKPTTVVLSDGTLQLEGNITYFWNAPGASRPDSPNLRDGFSSGINNHMLRGQLVSSFQLIGPLQLTLTALAVFRSEPGVPSGAGLQVQAGVRLRFVSRSMND